ncbi:MAG: glycosyltransferase family 2 protein [Oligoflexia bacterium]|nr:glycosyltransferase family 2 protein [Oligoflexia bacterium]
MKKLTYSILVPTCNRPELMERFLKSVSAQSRKPDEVVVIDQSDDGKTKGVFEAWNAPGVKKTYLHRTVKSLILARNAGIDASGAYDLVCFFDDDIVLEPEFCERMVERFEHDVEGRFAGGMGTMVGTPKRNAWIQKIFFMPHDGDGKFTKAGAPTFCHWKDEFCETEFLSGGITFWRKSIIQAFRFDERLVGYGHGDDVDVSYRTSRKYKHFYEPRARCFHDPHSPGRDKVMIFRRGFIQNSFYLAQKNGIPLWAFGISVLGYIFRDLILLDHYRLRGDLMAVANILRGRIDTVVGYDDFIRAQRQIS